MTMTDHGLHDDDLDAEWQRTDEEATQSRIDLFKRKLLDTASLDAIPPLVPLIDGWLNIDTINWLSGKRANGKSFVVLDMAGCVANGLPWMGCATKQGPVLYVIAEGLSGLRNRVRAWEEHTGIPMRDVAFLPGPLSLVADQAAVAAVAKELGAVLVVYDTQSMVTVGMDEVSSKDMGMIVSAVEYVRRETRACVLMVHHEAVNGDRPRGHSTMDGAAQTMIRVVKDGGVVWVGNTKQKDGPQLATLTLQAKHYGHSLVLVPPHLATEAAVTESETIVLRCLQDIVGVKDEATWTDLRDAASSRGLPRSTFDYALKRLGKRGLVAKKGKGRMTRYVIPDPNQGVLGEDG